MDYGNERNYLSNLVEIYGRVDKGLILKIYELYRYDFLMFGYEIEPFL